ITASLMQLHKPTLLNRFAKSMAKPLSRIACSRPLLKPSRAAMAYLNFLLGQGAGSGWDIDHEVRAAVSRIYRDHPVVFDIGTIDDVIQREGIAFVDFMKMDIEGYELFALRGAKQALAEHRIGALAFEFGSGNVNSRTFFRDLWELLTLHGFRMWRVTPGGR